MVYLTIDATPVRPALHDDDDAVAKADGDEVVVARPNLIAHFPPRIEIAIAETIPVALDTAGFHFFDPETGEALR